MIHRILIGVLSISLLIEICFTFAGFVFPGMTLQQFRLGVTPDTLFLTNALSWTFVLISIFCFFALYYTVRHRARGKFISYILGFWWIAVGISIFAGYGKMDNLFIDTLKGFLLVSFTYLDDEF